MVFTLVNKKRLKFYKLGIICGILHQDYLKMRVKKVYIFKDIKLEIFEIVEYGRIIHLKIILKGRGFQGGSDGKMRRMWFGLEIDVAGLPPLVK